MVNKYPKIKIFAVVLLRLAFVFGQKKETLLILHKNVIKISLKFSETF